MALGPGSIAFVGFNGDGNDNVAFVALADIAQGTVINFTDSNWNGTGFANSESIFSWTATGAVAAGTVIRIDNLKATPTTSNGSVVYTNSNNTGLSNDNEVVYAYTGNASAPNFLAAVSNVGYGTAEGNLTNTGLTAGQNAVSLTGGVDIAAYNGTRAGQTSYANYLASINNAANWITQDGSGDQSADGTAPNAPFPTTGFTVTAPTGQTVSFSPATMSVTEGNSGTQTLTFTVTRAGGTTGAVSFSGTFAAGTTNAADFGGTLPASTFSGMIANGATSATITITISGDNATEANEAFTLTLTSATNPSATVAIGTASATGTITNDDGGTVISSNSSTPLILVNNDHVTISSGVTLSGATPVTWNAGSTAPGSILDNFGTISGTNRAIYTTQSAVSGSLTINNEAGATITAVKDAIKIDNLTSGQTGTLTINNDGTIRSTGTGDNAGQALDLDTVASSGVQVVINNSATGVIRAADADAIRPGSNATINNSGQILSFNGNDAIDFQTTNTGGVVNNLAGGVIDGGRHGITGDQAITVNNAGTLNGQLGAGINLDTAANVMSTVTNSGAISGHAAGATDGDAVDVDGLVTLDNSGSIEAFGTTTAGLSEALAIGGGSVHNRASGSIVSAQRAITVDDSDGGSAFAAITIVNEGLIKGGSDGAIAIAGDFADTLTNSGMIIGNVSLGGGADILNNSGNIDSVNMGAGNDIINLSADSMIGSIDGGLGDDTVHLLGTGTGALGATTGVENLVVEEGAWSVAATDYASVTIENGGILTSTVTLNGNDELSIEAGGKLTNATAITWAGGGNAVVHNVGEIEAATRVFGTTAGATGSLTFNNETTGTVRGPFSPQSAAAADATITINNAGMMESSGRVMDFQNLVSNGADVTINNLATGTIRQTGTDTDVIRPGQNTVLNNWGMITTAAGFVGGGDLIDYQSSTGGQVHNYAGGWMEASRHAVTGDNAVTVINEGTMIGRNGSAVNIDNGGTEAEKVFVTNRGTMEGRSAGLADSDGDAVDIDGLAQVLNYGRIAGLGARGLHDGEPNVSEGIAIGGGTILNYGADAEIYGHGRGIQVDNSSNSNALGKTLINNEGLIQGDGHGPEGVTAEQAAPFDLRGNEAINLVGDYDDEILNQSTGRIVGGVSMGGGNDHLQSLGSFTATGGSAIDMGAGNDTVYFYTGTTVQGTVLLGTGDDLLLSTAGSGFVIDAGDGNDQIYLDSNYSGNDTLAGGIGDDTIYAGAGDDAIDGGDGNDMLSGENGTDVIDGGKGNDTLMGGAGADTLRGGDGNDTIQAGTGDIVSGGADNDIIEVSTWNGTPASIDGGEGDDTVKLTGPGTGSLGATTGVENLVVQEGSWSIDGSESFTDITIKGGATVTSQISVAAGDHLVIEAGGTLTTVGSFTPAIVGGAVQISGAATIDNYGTILADYAVLQKLDDDSVLTFNNAAGALTEGVIARSNLIINNAGTMRNNNDADGTVKLSGVLNNLAGGLIESNDAGSDAVRIDGVATVNNSGTIVTKDEALSNNSGGDGVDFSSSAHGTLNNLAGGSIIGSRHGVTGKQGTTILNAEGASLVGLNGSGINFDNSLNSGAIVVTNYGSIEGRSRGIGDGDGDGIDTDGLLKLDNYGTIKGLGANAYHSGEPNVSEGIAVGGGVITNHAGGEIYGYGRAIQVDDSSNGDALAVTTIVNDGLIKGDGHGPENVDPEDLAGFDLRGNEAINLVGDWDDTLTNTGTIIGGVSMGGGDDTLFNSGTMTATGGTAVNMGAGDDVVTNFLGGTIQGAILLGDGNDQFFGNASAENVDGGQGNDGFNGGGGNDTFTGGNGGDVYSYVLGDGSDVIVEGAGAAGDVDLLLVDEVETGNVTMYKHGSDVEIVLANGDVVTLKDQLADGGVENIFFTEDGTILDRGGIEAALTDRGPVAADDTLATVAEDAPSFLISIADLLGNDSDADLDVLSITGLSDIVGGTAVIEGNNIRFTPGTNYNGPASFTYTVNDGRGGTAEATASFGVTAVNDGPSVTTPVVVSTAEDTALTGQIVASDIEGDALTYVLKPEAGAAHGVVSVDANGNWTYTPSENYNGPDSFTVLVSDGQATVEAVVTVGVTPVNDGPVAHDDVLAAVAEDAPSFLISFDDLVGNDTDADHNVLDVTALTNVVGGTAVIDGDAIRFTPAANYNGPASFTYTVVDGQGGTSQATASFDITSVNDGPSVTTPVAVSTAEDTALTGQIVASDIDGDTLTYVMKPEAGAAHGVVSVDANGNWTYTPNENYNGPDSFTVLVSDGQATVEAVVTVGVTSVNDGPVAHNDVLDAVAEDAPAVLISFADLLGNDTDADHDGLTVTGISSPVGGTFTIEADGIHFTPTANYNGPASFTYTVDDGHGGTTQANASFDITAVNDGPTVTTPVAVSTAEDTVLTGQIVASDIDGDTLTYGIKPEAGAAHGLVSIDANGNWTYTPDANYHGTDSFTVLVNDGHATVEALVNVGIESVNDTPVAVADHFSVDENETRTFDLLANDTDVDGGALSLSGFSVTGVSGIALDNGQAQGAFSIENGHLAFNPGDMFDALNDGDTATVTISYTTQDADGASSTADFVLTVNGSTDSNVIVGTDDADPLFGTDGADIIDANDGADYIFARDGADVIDAGKGADVVFGGAGNDVIDGGAGKDTLFGDTGDDTLAGGQGNDLLYGGAGNDTFVFHAGEGRDIVNDFQAGAGAGDVIQLDHSMFDDFNDLMQSGAVTDTAIGAQISYGDGSSITLTGVDKAHLAIDDFRFA